MFSRRAFLAAFATLPLAAALPDSRVVRDLGRGPWCVEVVRGDVVYDPSRTGLDRTRSTRPDDRDRS